MPRRAKTRQRGGKPRDTQPRQGAQPRRDAMPCAQHWPGDVLAVAAAVVGPLALYALSLPREVVLEDDGLFLMAGQHWGIAHPPGYPLYTLLCHLFMQWPFGSPAVLGHLASAVFGALASGAVHACARLAGASRLAALAGAWLFAASEHVWSQAIISDVYSLHALLFFASYALVLRAASEPDNRAWWLAASVVAGLGLANHWPLMVLTAPGLLLAAWPARAAILRSPRRLATLAAALLASAALPYLGMVLRSLQAPLISFHGPITDWSAFWDYLGRSGYADQDVNPAASWGDRLAYLQWFAGETIWQLTLPGFLLAVLGWALLVRRRQWRVAASGALAFLGTGVALPLILEFDFDYFWVAIFRPYSLVCYGLVAIWLAVGLTFAVTKLAERAWRRGKALGPGVAALAGMGLCAHSVVDDWPANNRAAHHFAAAYADVVFNALPPDAVLFVSGDVESAILGYYRFVEGRRADVQLVNTQGLVYGNRLFDPYVSSARKEEILRRFVAETDRPLFYATDQDIFTQGHGVRHYGFVREIRKSQPPGSMELAFSPAAGRHFEAMLAHRPANGWELSETRSQRHGYGQYLSYVLLSGDPDLLRQTRHLRQLSAGSLAALMGMAQVLLKFGDATHWPQIDTWLQAAERLQHEALGRRRPRAKLSKWRRAEFAYLQGVLAGRRGDEEEAVAAFRKSWAIHSLPSNPAIEALAVHGVTP